MAWRTALCRQGNEMPHTTSENDVRANFMVSFVLELSRGGTGKTDRWKDETENGWQEGSGENFTDDILHLIWANSRIYNSRSQTLFILQRLAIHHIESYFYQNYVVFFSDCILTYWFHELILFHTWNRKCLVLNTLLLILTFALKLDL